MPKQYQDIKASYLKRGKSLKQAKKLAAMTYNSLHPNNANPWLREKVVKAKRQRAKRMM